jgi:hypothetical protein
MNITDLISIVQRRLVYLSQLRTSAENIGDLNQVSVIDTEMSEAQDTLNKLKTLLT